MEIFRSPKEKCTITNNGKLSQDLYTFHKRTNTVAYFSLKSPSVFEVINLTFHLNEVTNKTTQRSRRKNFTKQAYESKLSNELHVVSNDICFFIIQDIVLEALISSDAQWITRFANNFIYWCKTCFLILV